MTFHLLQSRLHKLSNYKNRKCCILLFVSIHISPISTLFRGYSTQVLTLVIYRMNLNLHKSAVVHLPCDEHNTYWIRVRYFTSYLLHSKNTPPQFLHIFFKLATCIKTYHTNLQGHSTRICEPRTIIPLNNSIPPPQSCDLPVFKLSTLRGRPDWATATSFKAM